MGFDIEKAANGKIALDILSHQTISIIYLDLAMPEMGGAELMRIMLQDEKLKDIPIVIDTAQGPYTLPEIAKEFQGKLRYRAFNRPTSVDVIQSAIKELVGL